MSGRPGRSGGANRLSIEEHIQRGTLRSSHLKATGLRPVSGDDVEAEPVSACVVEGLSGPGLDFVTDVWHGYTGWTPGSLVLLHECGRLMDQLVELRGKRGEREAQRLLLSVLAQLRLS